MIRYERNQTIPAPYALIVSTDKPDVPKWSVMPLAWQPIQVGAS